MDIYVKKTAFETSSITKPSSLGILALFLRLFLTSNFTVPNFDISSSDVHVSYFLSPLVFWVELTIPLINLMELKFFFFGLSIVLAINPPLKLTLASICRGNWLVSNSKFLIEALMFLFWYVFGLAFECDCCSNYNSNMIVVPVTTEILYPPWICIEGRVWLIMISRILCLCNVTLGCTITILVTFT